MIPATDWDKKRRELNANRHPHDYLKDEKDMLEKLRDEYGARWKIASVLGVSEATIMKRMMRLGVAPSRARRHPLSAEQRQRVKDLRAEGHTLQEIVEKTGISFKAVWKIVKEEAAHERRVNDRER